MLEQAWSQTCSGLGVWARGMCCTSPFPRSRRGLGTQLALVQSSGLHSQRFLCFFITPRKHYLGYFCAGDIIVWLYEQTFAWICGSKGSRQDLRGAGWSKRCEHGVDTEWKEWASNFRSRLDVWAKGWCCVQRQIETQRSEPMVDFFWALVNA